MITLAGTRGMFGPSVSAGIIGAANLAGYRSGPVYLRRSMHVPPAREAVRDCMPALFELLASEPEPAVRDGLQGKPPPPVPLPRARS